MDLLKSVLNSIGPATIVLGIAYLARDLISNWLLRDLRRLETQLKAEADTGLDRIRHERLLLQKEHEVSFAKLHEDRADVVKTVYGMLVELLWAANNLLRPIEYEGEPSKKEKFALAQGKASDLYSFYEKHRIFLPEATCDQMDKVLSTIGDSFVPFGLMAGRRGQHNENQWHEAWATGWKKIQNEVPEARRLLEAEFRLLLGSAGGRKYVECESTV